MGAREGKETGDDNTRHSVGDLGSVTCGFDQVYKTRCLTCVSQRPSDGCNSAEEGHSFVFFGEKEDDSVQTSTRPFMDFVHVRVK